MPRWLKRSKYVTRMDAACVRRPRFSRAHVATVEIAISTYDACGHLSLLLAVCWNHDSHCNELLSGLVVQKATERSDDYQLSDKHYCFWQYWKIQNWSCSAGLRKKSRNKPKTDKCLKLSHAFLCEASLINIYAISFLFTENTTKQALLRSHHAGSASLQCCGNFCVNHKNFVFAYLLW